MDYNVRENLYYTILSQLTEKEEHGATRLKSKLINSYLNLGINEKPSNRDCLRFIQNVDNHTIAEALKNKNCVVMFGGGKDSAFVLTVARALQLILLKEYNETFELRVAIGRHPGMLDCLQTVNAAGDKVDGNIERVLKVLQLHNDPLVDMFFIDNSTTIPYNPSAPISTEVLKQTRDNVLLNGHLWGGAGRRTFCDDCNKGLARWIAVALCYNGGADLYMTGDSRKELNTQIGTDIPKILDSLAIKYVDQVAGLTDTQSAFQKLELAGRRHSQLVHGDSPNDIKTRKIPHESIPQYTRLITVFDYIKYDSAERMPFLEDFLKFDFDSLMFSFTETDCGNPALMCHNIGLITELLGSTYANGVQAYTEYAIGKMREKGFSDKLIAKIDERYKNDTAIALMRTKVESYSQSAYALSPVHLEAMVYAPFTQKGKNLKRWLKFLGDEVLLSLVDEIRELLQNEQQDVPASLAKAIKKLNQLSGLSLKQMRHLWKAPLMMNNFKPHKTEAEGSENHPNKSHEPEELQLLVKRRLGLMTFGENDSLYVGTINPKGLTHKLTVMGR